MVTLYVDFNARTEDDCIRLDMAGARRSLELTNVQPGQWVWLSDGELRVGGHVEEERGQLLARPDWTTLEDLSPSDDGQPNLETPSDRG
jgi:hypothetical protein